MFLCYNLIYFMDPQRASFSLPLMIIPGLTAFAIVAHMSLQILRKFCFMFQRGFVRTEWFNGLTVEHLLIYF